MRRFLSAFALPALCAVSAAPALAQPYAGPPRGSYERQCTDIRMNGQILSATCRGARGPAQSSINVLSCSTDISVDAEGGLTCIGPGGGAPPSVRDAPPGYGPGSGPDYGPGYGPRPPYAGGPGGGYDGSYDAITLFEGSRWRGAAVRIEGDMPNLDRTGLNDRVGSIRLPRRSGPWLVCTDAGFRGRCITIGRSVRDTRALGMGDSISSVRPAY